SHAPVPFPTRYALPIERLAAYREEVLRAREAYRGRIEVRLGLELDAVPALAEFNRARVLPLGFDYCIGSVHYLGVDNAGAPWSRAAVEDALRALAAAGTIVELSTGGWHYGLDQPFPSPWIARRCRDLGIPMTPSGDTHRPDEIAYRYADALALLRDTGHREIAVLDASAGRWVSRPLPDGR